MVDRKTHGPRSGGLLALLLALGFALLVPAVALAGVNAASTITFPSTVTVGQTPSSTGILTLTNLNTAPNAGETNFVCNPGDPSPPCGSPERGIIVVPSCASISSGACTLGDPGVFVITTATGDSSVAGNACAGTTFTPTAIGDAVGSVRLTPQPAGTHVVLPPGATCTIDIGFTVAKVPSHDQDPTKPGVQTAQAAQHGQGDGTLSAFVAVSSQASTTVLPAPTTVATTASAGITLGSAGTLSDNATVSGLVNPVAGSTIDFKLYGPNDATCAAATPVFESVVPYPLPNGPAVSNGFTPTQAGTYRWTAAFSGDTNNAPSVDACNGTNESVVVAPATPTIATTASGAIVLGGGALGDSATVSGRVSPLAGETVTFKLYGPDDATCANTPVSTSTVAYPVAGGSVTATAFTPTAAGTYRWVASFSGDANNAALAGTCNAANESTLVTKAAPAIVTTASGNVNTGGSLTDSATVTGRVNPLAGETVTFNLFGPNDATCSTTAVSTSTVAYPVAGGPVPATAFTPTAPGTYRWTATFSGDANNAAVTEACNGASESTLVSSPPGLPQIAVTKSASPASEVEPGGTFTFTAQVSNPSTTVKVKITQLVDNIYGDLSTRAGSTCGALIGVVLDPGASSAPCSFPGPFTGKAGAKQTDTITVNGTDTNGMNPVTATAMATVTLTPVGPQIAVTKSAAPASQVAPGGTFTFTARVTNPSTLEPVTITKLVDNVYGDLATLAGSTCGGLINVTLQPGASSAPCTFPGAFSGAAGASQTDTITVTGVNNGTTVTATAQATVTLTPATKPASLVSPVVLHVPGACVTQPFKIYVSGQHISSIVYYLDSKRIATVSHPDSSGRLSVTIRPGALSKGRTHHLTAVVAPVAHSGQPVRTVRRTFAVCAPAVIPRFTG